MLIALWSGFCVLLVILLTIDLVVLNRKAHVVGPKEAIGQWLMWIGVAALFNVGLYVIYEHLLIPRGLVPIDSTDTLLPRSGWHASLMFLQAYLVEQMLSMDNMLVIAMLMAYFKVPGAYQHRVLFWGIVGAVVLRGSMIIAGAALVQRFEWVMFVFGAMLLITAIKMMATREGEDVDLDKNLVVRISKAILPVSKEYDGARFSTRINGKFFFTPMLLALLVVDLADAVFAIDSIPATMAFTHDTFVAFASNCFAVLGLRALYFAIAALIERFVYLKACLVVLLGLIGFKMILHHWVKIPETASLLVVVGTLVGGVAASKWFPPRAIQVPSLDGDD